MEQKFLHLVDIIYEWPQNVQQHPWALLKERRPEVFTMKTSSSRRPRPRGGPSASHTSPPPIFIYALNAHARVGQRGRNNISSHFPPTLTLHTSAKFYEKSPSRQTKLRPVEKRFVKVEALSERIQKSSSSGLENVKSSAAAAALRAG